MTRIYGDSDFNELILGSHTEDGQPEVLPRVTAYGSQEAIDWGLKPIEEMPDVIVDPKDWKEVIAECHAKQIFPMYHEQASGVYDDGWSQDGFGFCWAYSLTSATMDCRAAEGLPAVRLAPFSLGWLVGWHNQGYYLDAAIKGASEKGIAPASHVPEYKLNTSSFKNGWQEEALKYRPTEWWDTRPSAGAASMISQALAILRTGRPGYIAYDWWRHALNLVGMEWDESKPNNIVWVIRNSHGEKEPIRLSGSKGVPDELYGVRATLRAE